MYIILTFSVETDRPERTVNPDQTPQNAASE